MLRQREYVGQREYDEKTKKMLQRDLKLKAIHFSLELNSRKIKSNIDNVISDAKKIFEYISSD